MADGKTKKDYKVKVADGRMTVSKVGADGLTRTASCPFPLIWLETNEETGQTAMVKKTRKQTELYLLSLVLQNK